jgi:hypothetical protein
VTSAVEPKALVDVRIPVIMQSGRMKTMQAKFNGKIAIVTIGLWHRPGDCRGIRGGPPLGPLSPIAARLVPSRNVARERRFFD